MSLISISQLVIVTKTQYASCELQIGILKTSKAYFKDIPISFQNSPPQNGDLLSFYTLRCLFFCNTPDFCMSKHFSFTVPTLKSKYQQSIVQPSVFIRNTQEFQICFSQNISPLQEAFCLL